MKGLRFFQGNTYGEEAETILAFAVLHLRAAFLPGDEFIDTWTTIEIYLRFSWSRIHFAFSIPQRETILWCSNEIEVGWMKIMENEIGKI